MKFKRVVLVDDTGRIYDQAVENVEVSIQDTGHTLKIFVTKKKSAMVIKKQPRIPETNRWLWWG